MKKSRKVYSVSQLFSAVIMILALMWLTVSTPFVLAHQQGLAKKHKMEKTTTALAGSEEETTKTPGNNTEEKTPGGNSFSEEYLHDNHKTDPFFSVTRQYQKCENAGTYIAFHGELLVPPPNFS
ncbi:MAG: hypothetical protein ABIN74_04485 [Ferruginibacter sp.]